DPEPLAPHPARADEARKHGEERAEVHHREPREDHPVYVRGPNTAERQPREPSERLGADELGRQHEAEEVDDRQPDDRGKEPVLGRTVRKRKPAKRPLRLWNGILETRLAWGDRLGHRRNRTASSPPGSAK